jgi:hypothetical protein
MSKKITVYCVILISILFQTALAIDHWHERAGPVTVLSVPVFNRPQVCYEQDFTTTCNVRDQVCKTRKEKCGDAIGALVNDELLSLENGFSNMQLHNGKYDKVHGIDEYRSAEKSGYLSHHFTENKAHTSQLDRRTNQGSNQWHKERLIRAYSAGNLSQLEYLNAMAALESGNVTRAVSHTTLNVSTNGSSYFQAAFKPIISNEPERREAELQTYCKTIHPSVMNLSYQYSYYQTPEQRSNLNRLNNECQQITPSPTSLAYNYRHSEPSGGVCYVRKYGRENLHKFLNFLSGKGYSYASIATGSTYSGSTVGNILRDRNYAPYQNYQKLWDYLTRKFSKEFELWSMIP